MKVLCTGDRNWTGPEDLLTVMWHLKKLGPGTEIVHGNARGVDNLCDGVAQHLGYKIHRHKADWVKYGKAAGVIRNQAMLDAHPDIALVLAFHNDLAHSKGTKDMVRRAEKKGIRVERLTTLPPAARAE